MKKLFRKLLLLVLLIGFASVSMAHPPSAPQVVGGSGTITSVGDGSSAAALDGSSDGGTYIRLYDDVSFYMQLAVEALAANYTLSLPPSIGTSGQLFQSDGDNTSSWTSTLANVTVGGFTASRAMETDASGNLEVSDVTDAELALLDGRTGLMEVDGTSSSSGTYEGFIVSGVNAGETITAGDIVYMDDTSNEWMLADANAAGEFPAIGMAAASGTDGNAMDVLIQGVARLDSWSWTAEGVPLYLSETAGDMTETAPSDNGDCIQVVATVLAITNDTILFSADTSWFLDDGS